MFSKSTLINLILCDTVAFWCVNVLKINSLWWLKCETALLTFSPFSFFLFKDKEIKNQVRVHSHKVLYWSTVLGLMHDCNLSTVSTKNVLFSKQNIGNIFHTLTKLCLCLTQTLRLQSFH